MSAGTEELLAVVSTIQFGRKHTLHGSTVGIDGMRVYVATRCGIRTDEGEGEYTITHGVVTCPDCLEDRPRVSPGVTS